MANIDKITKFSEVISPTDKINEVIDAVNNGTGGGSGSDYVLPAADNDTLGGVKIGSHISVTPDGTISIESEDIKGALGYTPANSSDVSTYVLPKATSNTLGGVTIGDNITVADGKISVSAQDIKDALGYTPADSTSSGYVLPKASSSVLGGVKIGSGVNVTADGVISVDKTIGNTTGTLAVNRGGTGATTASAAAKNLGIFNSSGHLVLPDGSELWIE